MCSDVLSVTDREKGVLEPDSHPSNCLKQRKDGGLLCPSPALGKPCWLQVGSSVRGHSLKVWGHSLKDWLRICDSHCRQSWEWFVPGDIEAGNQLRLLPKREVGTVLAV